MRQCGEKSQKSVPVSSLEPESSERSVMTEASLNLSVRLEKEGITESGASILRLRQSPVCRDETGIVPDRLTLAAEWVLDLDAQYRELILVGRNPRVIVPAGRMAASGRVEHETLFDYRKLQLSLGEIIRPLILDPPELKELYPFQRQGVEWLAGRFGGILADDMGLGKTVQVIAAMRLLFNRAELRTALVVCPKSLIATWEREFSRWAPELGVAVLTPPAQLREDAWKVVAGRRHVLLTNYEQLRHPPKILRQTPPYLVVADEAHRIRKRSSRITSGILQLEPKRFWALTGTPLERDLEDLATLLSMVAPKSFAPADAKLHPSSLRSRARPYVLRRRKQEVLEELPPVLDTTDTLELSEAQERAYQTAVKEYRLKGEKGDELALLTRLQALCDIDSGSRESCKVDRILDLLGRIREQHEKAIVFSHRLEPLRELQRQITERWGVKAAVFLEGSMDSRERDQAVSYFRNDERALVLLASARVGSEGLTLVEANHVFLLNQWWNPSANDQARDRVVRVGQRRKVRVYRFCCRGTIEETIERILKSKRELFDDAVERLAQGDSAGWTQVLREVGIERLLLEKCN